MRTRWAELRTWAAAVDPGRTRLHLAATATASMIVAALLMSVVRTLTGEPVTVVLFAVVLAMISNLAVNEPQLRRRRTTTALMVLPAAGAATLSVLLESNRIVADVVFVLVMVVAVAIRRYGPRGMALGMAAFMPYFFVQFLQAHLVQLPYLLASVVIGIGSTFVLRCLVFTEPAPRVVDRLVRAFEARLHGLTLAVLEVLESREPAPSLDDVRDRQARLNETALLVADRLDDMDADVTGGRPGPGDDHRVAGLRQWVVDTELAAERLAVSTRRLVGHADPVPDEDRSALTGGVRALVSASAVGTSRATAASLFDGARDGVHRIVEAPAGRDAAARVQRIGFAVQRLADAMQTTVDDVRERISAEHADAGDRRGRHEADRPPGRHERAGDGPGRHEAHADADPSGPAPDRAGDHDPSGTGGLALHTRQAVQVGIATSLAIVAGELISPARWYWAVIAAFVVFAGTSSRGDVLSRGWARVVGTAGGVIAGMLLAVLVGENVVASLVLLFVCVFLALYLVRISQAMMAFWITAVLALLYGVIGQFSVATLLLRVEETAVGGLLGMLAAFLVLPTRSRTAFGDALDEALRATADGVTASVDRVLGRVGADAPEDPLEIARRLDAALGTVRLRARPLEHPVVRRPLRRGVRHTVRVLSGLDHYVRLLATLSRTLHDPAWASTLGPAADRVTGNLDGLRRILLRGYGSGARIGGGDRDDGGDDPPPVVRSAEELIDAAEADASASGPTRDRAALLGVARMLRRIDQLTAGLARELTGGSWSEPGPGDTAPTGRAAEGRAR